MHYGLTVVNSFYGIFLLLNLLYLYIMHSHSHCVFGRSKKVYKQIVKLITHTLLMSIMEIYKRVYRHKTEQ